MWLPRPLSEGLRAPLWAPLAGSGWPHTLPDTLGVVRWRVWGIGCLESYPNSLFHLTQGLSTGLAWGPSWCACGLTPASPHLGATTLLF